LIFGQIGFSAMESLKLTIDYRDGLVRFVGKWLVLRALFFDRHSEGVIGPNCLKNG